MGGTDDRDDLVEFHEGTRVDDGGLRMPVREKRPDSSVSLDGQPESTRFVAPPAGAVGLDEDAPPESTVLIESPFAVRPEPAAPPPPSARLVVLEGNDQGKEFSLGVGVLTVGRALDCQVVLNDPTVSRRHFQIEHRAGTWRMTDLGSGNGTRVNGQRMPAVDLETGTRIEVGQSALEFRSDGGAAAAEPQGDEEKTRAVDVALPLPGSGETAAGRPPRTDVPGKPAPAPRRDAPPPPEAVRPRSAPRIEVAEEAPPDDGAGFPIWPVVGGSLLAVVIAVVVAQFVFGVRVLPIGDEPAAVAPAGETATDGAAETAGLLDRARQALQDRQWDPAIALLTSAKEKDPGQAGIEESLSRARDEKRAASLLAAATDAMEKGTADEARALVSRIADTSVYFPDARKLMADLDARHLDGRIDAIRKLVAERKKGEAKAAYVTLLTDHPEDPRAMALRDELVAAGVALDPPPRPAVAAAPREASAPADAPSPRSAPAREPAAPREAAPSGKPGRLDFPKALALYDRGQFGQAASDLRNARAKGDELAKAQALADRIERFAAAFAEGRDALAGKRLDRAEAGLQQSLRLDQEVDGHYAGEIRGLLGDTYRGRAAQALQNADYVLAARSARRALSYRSDDDMARSILDKCLVMAQKQYDAAAADAKAGRKDEARGKARAVLDIVPKGHPLEEKAAALLK